MLQFLLYILLFFWQVYSNSERVNNGKVEYTVKVGIADPLEEKRFKRHYENAELFRKLGKYEGAIYLFQKSLDVLKENKADKGIGVGLIYYDMARLAIMIYNSSASHVYLKKAAYFYEKGIQSFYEAEYNHEMKNLSPKRLTMNGHQLVARIYQQLYVNLMSINHYATFYYSRVELFGEYDEENYSILRTLALLCNNEKQHEEGIPFYKKLLKYPKEKRSSPIFPDYQAYLYLADAYFALKNFKSADKYYYKLIHYDGFQNQPAIEQANVFHHWGVTLAKRKKYNKALSKLSQAFEAVKNFNTEAEEKMASKILYDQGVVNSHKEYYDEAYSYFMEAYSLYLRQETQNLFERTIYLRGFARACYKQGKVDMAIQGYEEITQIWSENNSTNRMLILSRNEHDMGKIYYDEKNYLSALTKHLTGLQYRLSLVEFLPDPYLAYSYLQVCKTLRKGWGFYASFSYCNKGCPLNPSFASKILCQENKKYHFRGTLLSPIMRRVEDIAFAISKPFEIEALVKV